MAYKILSESMEYGSPLWALHEDGRKERIYENAYGHNAEGPYQILESELSQYSTGKLISAGQDNPTMLPASYVPGGLKYPRGNSSVMDQFMFDVFPTLAMAGLTYGAATAGSGASAAAGTGAASSELAGTALYSTPASLGSTVSTPALTTFAGPTGTSLLSTSVPTASLSGGALASGAVSMELLNESGGTSGGASGGGAASTNMFGNLSASDVLTASSLVSQGAALFAGGPESAPGRSGDRGDRGGPSMENRDRAFELRRQAAGRAATAAGAKRSDNEADLLGSTGRTTSRRKTGQQRAILGY